MLLFEAIIEGYMLFFDAKSRVKRKNSVVTVCRAFVDRQPSRKIVDRVETGNIALVLRLGEIERVETGNIALVLRLDDVQNPGRTICVVNTHILADPEFGDVKLWQAQLLYSMS